VCVSFGLSQPRTTTGHPPHPGPIDRPCVQPSRPPMTAPDDRPSREGAHVHSWTIRRDRHSVMTLHQRYYYAAGFHRDLRTCDITQSKSFPSGRSRPGARCDPSAPDPSFPVKSEAPINNGHFPAVCQTVTLRGSDQFSRVRGSTPG